VRAQAEELAAAGDELDARERTIAALRAAVTERDQRVARLRHELDELERQNAGYQEQVLRAFQKIKSDEATVARAKKAMAIALTLLDDADQAAAVEAAQPDE
jgi:predicted RNase H-like nuclease (RuvC/YqgF family)